MSSPSSSEPTPLTSSESGAAAGSSEPLLGSTLPRLSTPPLVTGPPGPCPCHCALTEDTSYGFDVIAFARDVLEMPLDPWQELAVIHGGELLPDGRPRFRHLLILVARQNGKTLLAKVLVSYWLFVEDIALVMNTSTDRSYAKRFWSQIIDLARGCEWTNLRLGREAERKSIGEESFKTLEGAELIFAANNGRAARSTTLWRWLCDEIREHHSRDCWESATGAMNAVASGQVVCISNQGGDDSIVLDSLRAPALEYIQTGHGDPRLGLLEWSAPDGAEADDLEALAAANPNMGRPGHGPEPDALIAAGRRARRAGGLELSGFTTEIMCRRVTLLDPAIEPELWAAALADPIDLSEHRDAVALCLDVSLAADHATLLAAALVNGRVYLEVVAAWDGPGCTRQARDELPALVARVGPRVFGWFPAGPAAVLAADLQEQRGRGWPPRRPGGRRVKLEPITTDTAAAAMSFAEMVKALEVAQPGDPMLDAHIANAQRQRFGDRWVFGRRGAGPVDGSYAAAGGAWLARTMPPPPPPLSAA